MFAENTNATAANGGAGSLLAGENDPARITQLSQVQLFGLKFRLSDHLAAVILGHVRGEPWK